MSSVCTNFASMKRRIFFNHNEELWNAWSHFAGIAIGTIGGIVLLNMAYKTGDRLSVFSVVLYVVGMLSSYVSSTVYHALSAWSKWKERLRNIDHAAIYWHIAGSYSPITLIALRDDGYWGWGLFIFVWSCALVGTGVSFRKLETHSNIETLVFLGMGLSVLVAIKGLYDAVSTAAFAWIIAEGVCYIAGALFYTLPALHTVHRRRYLHTVFHFFVLGGTICHILAIWNILA